MAAGIEYALYDRIRRRSSRQAPEAMTFEQGIFERIDVCTVHLAQGQAKERGYEPEDNPGPAGCVEHAL